MAGSIKRLNRLEAQTSQRILSCNGRSFRYSSPGARTITAGVVSNQARSGRQNDPFVVYFPESVTRHVRKSKSFGSATVFDLTCICQQGIENLIHPDMD